MNNISIERYPAEMTLTLSDFLVQNQLMLRLIETCAGTWFARLEGASIPEYYSERHKASKPASDILASRCFSSGAAMAATAERLTLLSRLAKDDGTEIDLCAVRVTSEERL